MRQLVFLQIRLVLLHHHLFIQNAQIGFQKTRFKFLPKRKPYSNQTSHNVHSESNTPSSLPHYSPVTTNSNDYSLTTSSVDCEMDTPVRIYSKTNYSFPPPSFNTDHSDFFTPPT